MNKIINIKNGSFFFRKLKRNYTLVLSLIAVLWILFSCEDDNSAITIWPKSTVPKVEFTMSPNPARVGESISFVDTSVVEEGEIVTWNWDFGNDVLSQEQQPIQSFSNAGTYEVSLTVTTDLAVSETLTQELVVEEVVGGIEIEIETEVFQNNELENGFYYGEVFTDSILFKGMEVNFALLDINPVGTTYLWDFGDGTTTSIPTPNHIYTQDGQTFEVTVSAVESDGFETTFSKKIYIPGILWSFVGGKQELASPTLDNEGNIYLGGRDGIVYKIDHENGQKIWEFNAMDDVRSSIALSLDESTLYFGSFADTFFAIDATSGTELWDYEVGDRIDRSSPAIDYDGSIYFGCQDGFFRKLDASGNLLWEIAVQDQKIEASPLVYMNKVFIAMGNEILALNTASGNREWSYQIASSNTADYLGHFAISATGVLFAGGQDTDIDEGYVFALSSEDGQELWRTTLPAEVASNSPLLSPDESVLFISTEDGDGSEMGLLCF